MLNRLFVFSMVWFWVVAINCNAGKQLHNLPKAEKPRFKITDRVWPEKAGEADVCLWKDDKLCAVSYTIDDNNAPDHSWWIEQGKKYGFKFTWFIITGRVGTGGFWGTWDDFNKLKSLGHDVQSHSVTHLYFITKGDKRVKNITDEYKLSQEDINSNMPDNKCVVLAYPGGASQKVNDIKIAGKYYIGARGTSGHINRADMIDYMQTCSLGNGINITDKGEWCQFKTMLDSSLRGGRNYRGWCCAHFHSVKENMREDVIKQFEVLKEHSADVWMGLFREVIMYGQERDSAKLNVISHSDKEIKISITDDMDDNLFDYPLTVKIRMPDKWEHVTAEQSGHKIKAIVIKHNDNKFALVDVVPDKGIVVVHE